MKTCKLCNHEKPFDAFALLKRPHGKTYYRSECKECCLKSLKAHMKKKADEQRLLADAALKAIEAGILKDPRC